MAVNLICKEMRNMMFELYKKEDYEVGTWAGGTTTQLAIYPVGADYKKRDFLWRLSSATVDLEESDFTPLPDYDRTLIVLDGEVVIVHKGVRAIRLRQYEQDRFSGAYDTKSYGCIVDFNLMVRKGSEGFCEVITLKEEITPLEIKDYIECDCMCQGFYCAEGFAVIEFGEESLLVKQGELLVTEGLKEEAENFAVMGEGKIIRTEVYFDAEEWSISKLKAPKAKDSQSMDFGLQNTETGKQDFCKKQEMLSHEEMTEQNDADGQKSRAEGNGSFEDFAVSAKICWTNFRGSKYIFKSLKDIWYDQELQKGIDRIERLFIPFFICLIGMGIAGFGIGELWGIQYIPGGILLWLLLDFILINPLLYFASLPKPVKPHIKKLSELTEAEMEIYNQQKSKNRRVDSVLKKYEITGRNKYIE